MAVAQLFTDQMGCPVRIEYPLRSIVSLVPSQTELLADLGLDEIVTGITKFCVHPPHWRHRKTIIGGTKQFDFDTIHRLNPNLIIGNKEENYREGIEKLRSRYPVWMSDITTLEDALSMIRFVGNITDATARAYSLAASIENQFRQIERFRSRRVLYLIWRKPWMAAGTETFIHTILTLLGLENCIVRPRYPELTVDHLQQLTPDVVLLSSEPYPFREKHADELMQILPESKIVFVDGEMFSWYGSRLLKAPEYFQQLKEVFV
jgi:ABC-type Fe3+-hydroxamate transport system substrate-binding protein